MNQIKEIKRQRPLMNRKLGKEEWMKYKKQGMKTLMNHS